MNIREYIRLIDDQWRTGMAREHSYRPALQQYLNEMLTNYEVINEPSRISCGAPDYIIAQKSGAKQPVFFIEAKDLFDSDLDGLRAHKEQFERYKASLDYIVFTDYLDFHIYEHGEWVKNIRIGEQQGQHIRPIEANEAEFEAMMQHLANSAPVRITSASRLAHLMAGKARLLADVITKAFENDSNSENAQLQAQLNAFRTTLIHDLDPKGFADIYAQTIAYGMFAARLHDTTPDDFSRHEAAELIPKTNPFLRKIFQQIAGYDLDERIAWIVDDLAQTFLVTDIDRVMKSYGNNDLHSDMMIHFYEEFLSAYDPDLRKSKGVWYTPQPVVSFIVRSVDEILQREFNLPMGLADDSKIDHKVINEQWDGKRRADQYITRHVHRVQILDPATGTGTFLAEAIRQIHSKFDGMQGMWQGYVEEHLLPRLHGFELLMASYAVAHLKIDMMLRSLGYDSAQARNQRLKIYLTNSLEECHPDTGTLWAQWLSSEASEANYVKRDCPVMVMIGNPPYSISSSNKGEWITQLISDYKQNLNERNIQPLSDDYIKFVRLGQNYVERNGQGILAYINNNSFIDGIIHREMRHQLLLAFDEIYILNLHGNARKKEVAPDGSKDENVFDIMQGVSINLFIRRPDHQQGQLGRVFYNDLFGLRENKYEYLDNHSFANMDWKELPIVKPNYFFVPKDFGVQEEYDKGIKIDELMTINACGIVSSRDSLLIHFEDSSANVVKANFFNLSEEEFRNMYKIKDSRDWTYTWAKRDVINSTLEKINYRPFDNRSIIFTSKTKGIVQYPRFDIMKHMINKGNISILVCKQQSTFDFQHIFVSQLMTDKCTISSQTKEASYQFPLYIYTTDIDGKETRVPNLNREEWQKFNDAVGEEIVPEVILCYVYGILHSPSYREQFKEFLKIDFPRIPLPRGKEEFDHYADRGNALIGLHLMKNADKWKLTTHFDIPGSGKVEAISYADGNVWINNEQYFGNVSETAWNAYIGGYQPAQKWLKDRRGRVLSFDDIRHYQRIIHALDETQRIMNDIG